jgi:hypothetical protein
VRCPDPPVHPAAGSALRGPLRALGALAAVATSVWVVAQVAPFLAVAVAVCAVLAVAGVPVLRWAGRLAVVRWPAREREAVKHTVIEAELVRAPYQILAQPLAITASPADSVEHSRPRRYRAALREVTAARAGEKLPR